MLLNHSTPPPSRISLAILSALCVALYVASPNLNAQTDAIETRRSFSEDTTLLFEGPTGFQLPYQGSPDIAIRIDEGAQLTVEHVVSNIDAGAANALQSRTIDFTEPGKITFTGGEVIFRKANFFARNANTGTTEQYFIRGGYTDTPSELIFDTASTTFEGDVRAGFAIAGPKHALRFKKGFTMTIDRSKALNAEAHVFGAVVEENGTLDIEKDAVATIIAGKNDRMLHGLRFTSGAGAHLAGDITLNLYANDSPSLSWLYGIYAARNNQSTEISDFSSHGTLNIFSSGRPESTYACTLYSNRKLAFEKLNLSIEKANYGYGVFIGNGADVEIDELSSRIRNVGRVKAIAGSGGSISLNKVNLINESVKSGTNYGIYAENTRVTVKQALTLDALIAVHALKGSTVDIQKNFETHSESWISAGDGGTVKVNSSGRGVVKFSGATNHFAADNRNPGVIHMTLGGSLDEPSSWNVLASSTLDKLVLGKNARLNFFITPDMGPERFINNVDSVIVVSGSEAVVLANDPNTGIALVLDGIKFAKNDVIGLITSEAGFSNEEGVKLVKGQDLTALKQRLNTQNIESLARIAETELKPDQYTLRLESDNRLVATILALNSRSTIVNNQTNAVVASSLSTYGALFAADDLFVDTVLRSREGKHQTGLFAAARAGRWHFDALGNPDMSIVSGLIGYAAMLNQTEMGGFLEMGHTAYDLHTTSLLGKVSGNGKHNYAGMGLYINNELPIEGWSVTGYVKGGVLSNHYTAQLIGEKTPFDRTNAYWGAHLGTHFDLTTAKLRTRAFISYFYDGLESDHNKVEGYAGIEGARFDFEALNAHRIQIGSLLEYRYSSTLRPYFGATLEQTIRAKAQGAARDSQGLLELHPSNLEGSTGIFSAGWTYAEENGFSCEFGVNGYAGVRNGVSGQIQGTWNF